MRQEAQKNAGPGAALLGAVMRDGSFSQPRQQWTARTVVPNVANGRESTMRDASLHCAWNRLGTRALTCADVPQA